MKYKGYETLGQYVNKYPFNKTKIQTVNIKMSSDETTIISVTRPKIWHMNIVDAVNDMDEKIYKNRINSFDQTVIRTSIDTDGDHKTLNIFIEEYDNSPMLISSQDESKG